MSDVLLAYLKQLDSQNQVIIRRLNDLETKLNSVAEVLLEQRRYDTKKLIVLSARIMTLKSQLKEATSFHD